MQWTPEAWAAALAAMRERLSAAEILALHEAGAISGGEVLNGAWSQCYNDPVLRAKLVRQFRAHPDDNIVNLVGGGLEELARQTEERRSGRGSRDCGGPARKPSPE